MIHALGENRDEETGEHEVVLLPDGTRVPLLPSKNDVWLWESRVVELSGLQLSNDGKRAIVDVIQELRNKMEQGYRHSFFALSCWASQQIGD
jgi:hypothetical protein